MLVKKRPNNLKNHQESVITITCCFRSQTGGEALQKDFIRSFCVLILVLMAQPVLAYDGDYILEERFKAQLEKAKKGDPKAQYAVADMYRKGRGTDVSDKEALHWYVRAARQGIRKAAYKAGYLYLHSETLDSAPKKAAQWLKMASDSGYSPAQYELGLLYSTGKAGKQDNKMALRLLSKAKLAGHEPAEAAFDRVVKQMVRNRSQSR